MSSSPGQAWPWWPLLPLYPYGLRRTLVREIVPGQVWSFEQLQGVFYVAVPIRMTVLRLDRGLLLYAPVPPTAEVLSALAALEERFGPVSTIVLPTASGLEHKIPVPAMARRFPQATVWVAPNQWSFPLRLPMGWLGFPRGRTQVLGEQGYPHGDQLDWRTLGPLDLGLGSFVEVACLHRASGALLVTDALVTIGPCPPALFEADPTPLLFHARERGDEPLVDGSGARERGWRRLVLFASYLRPGSLEVAGFGEVLRQAFGPDLRNPRSYFGLYPFRWSSDWQQDFLDLVPGPEAAPQVAPVLERLVFPRCRGALLAWLRELGNLDGVSCLVPAHYEAPVPCSAGQLAELADRLEQRSWAPDGGSWSYLAGIDRALVALKLVPEKP
ncbi:DUF4336 domain-containing protein [Cyanobium sp. WAJ14-Wanaka]|uniref:DUF4336 domain-containing protein n=1 Tax=Cyanobium sp. WAJ14-Wanaka TaxID=2823725 RepID=UPI0020CCD6AF|nr:DUF4336 domain-containing protein [Cyanobium sp. WAJ14-Wanaka]